MDNGCKRAVCCWHRRSGKDKSVLNFTIKKMFDRVGIYYYLFPTYNQGSKILWDGIDKEGFAFLDHFPKEVVKEKNKTEMKVETINGSIFQIIGTDKIDRIVGTNPIGAVFSEYALQNPRAWDYIRPILLENGGWAVFNFTPRGMNHGYDILDIAKKNKDWFWQVLTVDDTKIISKEEIEKERQEGMPEELIQQEYYCSFESSLVGAYYSKQLQEARNTGRIGNIPYEPSLPVHTFWDLGIGDSNAIGFYQFVGKEKHMIDYYENSGEGLQHYAQVLQDRGYVYAYHWAPHDIQVRELGTGVSRLETAKKLGINFRIVRNVSIEDGINAGRMVFNSLWIDQNKCSFFLKALASYTKEWDDDRKCFRNVPYHDWTSHASDMHRYFALESNLASQQTWKSPVDKSFEQTMRKKRLQQRQGQKYNLRVV